MSQSNVLPFPPQPGQSPVSAPPPDAAVRAEALDIRRSFIVQAPAGSGKTTLLMRRFLKLLADDSVTQPAQVLAITFTNAAAAELRDRVLNELEDARRVPPAAHSVEPAASAALLENIAATSEHQPSHSTISTRELAHAVLARDTALGWQLLAQPHRLNIRTIDSVCAEIARSLPILSGSGGRLTPTTDAAALYHEAARRTLLFLGSGDAVFDAALRNLLLHRDGNLDDCAALLADMLEWRDQWGELLWGNLIPIGRSLPDDAWLDANVLPRLERALEHAITQTLVRADRLFPSEILTELADLAGHLGHSASTTAEPSPIACCAGLHDPPEAIAAHLGRWNALIHLLMKQQPEWRKERGLHKRAFKFDYDRKHPHHARLAAILDQLRHRSDLLDALAEVRALPPACYPADQWAVAKSLFRVLGRALAELQLVFAERGQCDFTEISLLACQALNAVSGVEDLSSALGARLQHLLVDEMQDTSTGQYRLFELLTASWDGFSQTVFLVGDPHQSIYLFRQARVERFVQSINTAHLGEVPLTPLALTANFRSQRALVDQFNADFRLIFPQPAPGSGPDAQSLPYRDADATQPPSPSSLGVVWHANSQPPRPRLAPGAAPPIDLAPTQALLDARTIAATADDWIRRPLPEGRDRPWRVAVLVRNRAHLSEITPELRRRRIPFRAVEIETLHERQEVLDLTALTRALLHPADRVALLAVLRAPWCGLSLADLHALTGSDDFTLHNTSILRLMESRASFTSPEARLRLDRVYAVLRAALASRSRLTAAQLVERTWRSLGGDLSLTPAQLTNARRFFELLDSLEASFGHIDTTQLEDRLDRLFSEPDPIPSGSPSVELLTIHKAKGLEWDLVLVPALERTVRSSPSRLLAWAVLDSTPDAEAEAHIMLAPIAARGDETDALTDWLHGRQRDRERAENKRLFYVACTRACQELHLFAAPTVRRSGEPSAHPDTLLAASWPAASLHFSAIASRSSTPIVSHETELADEEIELEANGYRKEYSNEMSCLHDNSQVINEDLIPPIYPTLTRLPSTVDPAARFAEARKNSPLHSNADAAGETAHFARPEGSFSARSFGNVVHACIELFTTRIANGATPASLLAELPAWKSRIAALLRADGLSTTIVARLARETYTALEHLLRDPDGQWLLAPHPAAAVELSVTSASGASVTTVRADRIFRAGPEPRVSGDTNLWIVDYKTASYGGSAISEFLATQRSAYTAQLEAYARVLAPAYSTALKDVRLALYFPTLPSTPRLIWWSLVPGA
ncbi:MAG TPA: UvrD-helicase domain-containing protein [Acidobacteriaceae bacterium]|nr:UvrD-helicase domain-containing protein [Acidobacteriaceae bacterium]